MLSSYGKTIETVSTRFNMSLLPGMPQVLPPFQNRAFSRQISLLLSHFYKERQKVTPPK